MRQAQALVRITVAGVPNQIYLTGLLENRIADSVRWVDGVLEVQVTLDWLRGTDATSTAGDELGDGVRDRGAQPVAEGGGGTGGSGD